jgi:hypothetical protein
MTMPEAAAAPPREMITKLDISEIVGDILSTAMARWNPVAVAYVDAHGAPQLSYRGSVQRFSATQLAMWVRNPEGGLIKALAANPALNFLYADWSGGDDAKRVYLNFVGRGHVETAESVRGAIYDAMPQIEKDYDAGRKGVAVVIDVTAVTGLLPGKFLRMIAG